MPKLTSPFGPRANTSRPAPWAIAWRSLLGVALVLLCVSCGEKAATPPRANPTPAPTSQADTATPTPPPIAPASPPETTPARPAETTSTETTPAQDSNPVLTGMTLTPATIAVGGTTEIKWTLSGPAPPGGIPTVIGGYDANSLKDAGQSTIFVKAGDTWQFSEITPPIPGDFVIRCTCAGVTYQATLHVVASADSSAGNSSNDSAPINSCVDIQGDSDDTVCFANDGERTTLGD